MTARAPGGRMITAAVDANEHRSRTASSVMPMLSEKQREWFEDIVARAGL